MAALAEAIGKDPSTVTAPVQAGQCRLCGEKPQPRDRRVCEVRLTDAGCALEPAMDRVSHTLVTTLTNSIPCRRPAATCRTMKAAQKNMSAADDSESKREPDSEPAAETPRRPPMNLSLSRSFPSRRRPLCRRHRLHLSPWLGSRLAARRAAPTAAVPMLTTPPPAPTAKTCACFYGIRSNALRNERRRRQPGGPRRRFHPRLRRAAYGYDAEIENTA